MSEREKLKNLARRGDQKALEEIFSELEQAERERELVKPNGAFSERVLKEVLVLNESGCGHFKFQSNGGSCIPCQEIKWVNDKLAASEAALRTLREASQRVCEDVGFLVSVVKCGEDLTIDEEEKLYARRANLAAALAAEGKE